MQWGIFDVLLGSQEEKCAHFLLNFTIIAHLSFWKATWIILIKNWISVVNVSKET